MHESGRATPISCLCADMPHANLECEQGNLLGNSSTQFYNLFTPRVVHDANVANDACDQCLHEVCICPSVSHENVCNLCGEPNLKPYEAYFCSLCQRVEPKVDMVNLRCCCEFDRKHISISTPRVFMTKEIAESQPIFSPISVDQKFKNKKDMALKNQKNIKDGMNMGM